MGVHDLWSILGPVRESVPLYSLTGKTLAVDLSLWVCEAQHVQGMMGKVTKPHLRNLFFRVSSLTLMGVKLVFVMEGEAPKIKAETMNKRTEMRFEGWKREVGPKTKTTKSTNRGRFNAVLRECAEMLDCLGVPWVKAAGEAESMCAYLDSQGLVDGCITNDGDAFLYGAQTVYRNFNLNTRDPQVDCYKTSRVKTELQLERETLVGLAILLGCDYIPKGIPGVGKEQALKLIKTLKGQTLLQRFNQWGEEGVGASERAVKKKVPHCNVCHHPGSAKAHERAGCVLCGSMHFCEPQDYDYHCPCDWHRYEQTHQASSAEASIRKKTLANDQFPFTEIINEFMVDKDRPLHNLKRRKPNILSMQNFAYDKMEWPKHYTSEKILVLMTYTELMNRKHGRETSSQIKPLRIWKPRVRNSVACYEVIWSKPDHYVFPEEQPADSQEEVRTVEEEALFRQAYPEVVELYLREKALAEENKTKKKKPKSKKEKPADPCDAVSDLLSQMSLKSSSADTVTQQPTTKTTPEPPVSSGQRVSPGEDRPLESGTRSPIKEVVHPPSPPCPEASASPSVSMVMEMLHLSDIDWEAPSFTSSPPAGARAADPKPVRISDYSIEGREKDTKPADLRPAGLTTSKPSLSDCSLRDRLLLRSTLGSVKLTEAPDDDVTKCVSSESNPVNSISSHCQVVNRQVVGEMVPLVDKGRSADSKPEFQSAGSKTGSMPAIQTQKHATQAQKPSTQTRKPSTHILKPSTHTQKPSTHTQKPSTHTQKPSTHILKPSTHTQKPSTQTLKLPTHTLKPSTQTLNLPTHTQSPPAPQTQTAKENGAGEPKPPHKYTFVKTTLPSKSAPPSQRHVEPVEDDGNRRLRLTTKKSVCTSVCSSSEDSDVENHHRGKQKRAKAKPKSKPHYLTDYSLKPISKLSTTKLPMDTAQPLGPKAFPASVGAQILGCFVPDTVKYQDVAPQPPLTIIDDDLFVLTPGSPVPISDSDDSVVCSESPLPLAERLRLKFMK